LRALLLLKSLAPRLSLPQLLLVLVLVVLLAAEFPLLLLFKPSLALQVLFVVWVGLPLA
jgi:hypothetical protein